MVLIHIAFSARGKLRVEGTADRFIDVWGSVLVSLILYNAGLNLRVSASVLSRVCVSVAAGILFAVSEQIRVVLSP